METKKKRRANRGVDINTIALRIAIQEAGFTQAQLARDLSITKDTIQNWLTGRARPQIETFYRLCEALKIEPNVLVAPSSELVDEGMHIRMLRFHMREIAGANEPPTFAEAHSIRNVLLDEGDETAAEAEVKQGQDTISGTEQTEADTESDATEGDE